MADLPTATLGRTGLEVTKLGYGAMELRGGAMARQEVDPAESGRVLQRGARRRASTSSTRRPTTARRRS